MYRIDCYKLHPTFLEVCSVVVRDSHLQQDALCWILIFLSNPWKYSLQEMLSQSGWHALADDPQNESWKPVSLYLCDLVCLSVKAIMLQVLELLRTTCNSPKLGISWAL